MRAFLLIFLLFLPLQKLLALQLTEDPVKPWPVDCRPCFPPCYPGPLEIRNIEDQVVVHLKDPVYEDGVLRTDKGGVLTAQGIRVQARRIVYTKKLDCSPPQFTLYCEGDLLIDYQDKALVGCYFYYDFLTSSGLLIDGKTVAPPWYVGGKEIFFNPGGELVIYGGYISTSESPQKDICVTSSRISVSKDRLLTADNLHLRLKGVPIAWFPRLKLDLKSVGESPLAVQVGYGGFLGTNLSLRYRFLTWGELYGYLRLDGYLGRGPGVGIETEYNPCNTPTEFYTRSYYAHDLSIDDPKRKDRYRCEGSFFTALQGNVTIEGFYDFVSDGDMAADYQRKDFDLNPAERTEFKLRKNTYDWIATLFTRVRVNRFQSINQELPTIFYSLRPFEIGSTGIFCENRVKASYFDYKFSDDIEKKHDFHSSRVCIKPALYRPFRFPFMTATPFLEFIGISYSNSPSQKSVGQALWNIGCTAETILSKCYGLVKHVVEPYVDFHYYTQPRVPLDRYYIFTINDAYDAFSLARIGVKNTLFTKRGCCLNRPIFIDIWTNAFFKGRFIESTVPKGYINVEWAPTGCIFVGLDSAWNFQEKQLDFINGRFEWSISQNAALSFEYRHRGRFDWRKADFYNFLLDVTRERARLLKSPLSDRRDTFLTRLFYRWNPSFWGQFIMRNGWHRIDVKKYTEFEIEVTRVLFDHWHAIATFEHRETDNRFSMTLQLAPSPPSSRW